MCPWPSRSACRIDVLVDSGMEEIERIASPGFGPGLLGRWQRYLFERQRRTDSPLSEVRWLGAHASPLARASVIQDHWPESVTRWVRSARTHGIDVATARPVSPVLAGSMPRRARPRLFVYQQGGVVRHVVCADSAVCFSRIVDDNEDSDDAVTASLAHVAERWGFTSVDVSLPPGKVLSDKATRDIQAICPGEHVQRQLPSSDIGSTEIDPLVSDVLCAIPSVLETVIHAVGLSHMGGELSEDARVALADARQRCRMRRLKLIVALSLVTAVVFAAYAGIVGYEHARRVASVKRDNASLLSELSNLRAVALGMDETPLTTARTLEHAALLDGLSVLPASDFLGLIASVLTDHPGIELDRIAWRTVHDDTIGTESLLSNDGVMRVEQQSWLRFPTAASDSVVPSRGVFELSGRSRSEGTLEQLQDAVQRFSRSIDEQDRVGECTLLESPLTGVADGPVSESNGFAAWRLRCLLLPDVASDRRVAL